jgi:uncharacterized membrane protein
MNASALTATLTLGAMSGIRVTGGPAALAAQDGGLLREVIALLVAGEMIVDKTSFVGNRIDPLPLAGRALMGALVGSVIARQKRTNIILGAASGATAAIVAAHVAFRLRQRLPFSNAVNGLLEDGVVIGVAAMCRRLA